MITQDNPVVDLIPLIIEKIDEDYSSENKENHFFFEINEENRIIFDINDTNFLMRILEINYYDLFSYFIIKKICFSDKFFLLVLLGENIIKYKKMKFYLDNLKIINEIYPKKGEYQIILKSKEILKSGLDSLNNNRQLKNELLKMQRISKEEKISKMNFNNEEYDDKKLIEIYCDICCSRDKKNYFCRAFVLNTRLKLVAKDEFCLFLIEEIENRDKIKNNDSFHVYIFCCDKCLIWYKNCYSMKENIFNFFKKIYKIDLRQEIKIGIKQ